MGLVCGVGISDKGDFKRPVDGVHTKEYRDWKHFIERCYSLKYQAIRPSYVGCSVSDKFMKFQNFALWFQSQHGSKLKNWVLDKDILFRGNKIYSEDTCVFVPSSVNSLLVKNNACRGKYPIGVSWHKRVKRYSATCGSGYSEQIHLGYFDSPNEAFSVYKSYKESVVKQMANKYKELLDNRAYNALMNYEVDVND